MYNCVVIHSPNPYDVILCSVIRAWNDVRWFWGMRLFVNSVLHHGGQCSVSDRTTAALLTVTVTPWNRLPDLRDFLFISRLRWQELVEHELVRFIPLSLSLSSLIPQLVSGARLLQISTFNILGGQEQWTMGKKDTDTDLWHWHSHPENWFNCLIFITQLFLFHSSGDLTCVSFMSQLKEVEV